MSSADKLIIETPEQTSIEFPLAGIGSRFLALAIDLLLRFAFILVLVGIGGILGLIGLIKAAGTQWVVAALIVAYFFMDVGYFAFFESVWNGQTPGKRWTHLRVIKDSGRPIGVPDAILRNLDADRGLSSFALCRRRRQHSDQPPEQAPGRSGGGNGCGPRESPARTGVRVGKFLFRSGDRRSAIFRHSAWKNYN